MGSSGQNSVKAGAFWGGYFWENIYFWKTISLIWVSLVFQGGFMVFQGGFMVFHVFWLVSMVFMVFGWFPWFCWLRTPQNCILAQRSSLGLAGRRPALA